MIIKIVHKDDITRELFASFIRHQTVDKCFRKLNGKWEVKSDPFIDDWSERDYKILMDCLKNTLSTNGIVYGAFAGDSLKGFCSIESGFFGKNNEYLDLSSLYVSEDMRGQGIGRQLFTAAVDWSTLQGAKKLYISAHSAVETQAFYKAMGCVEALEYNKKHVEAEPYDCQLEFSL